MVKAVWNTCEWCLKCTIFQCDWTKSERYANALWMVFKGNKISEWALKDRISRKSSEWSLNAVWMNFEFLDFCKGMGMFLWNPKNSPWFEQWNDDKLY